MKVRGLAIAALAVCVGVMATVAHAEMKAGEWELTVKLKMPSVPIPIPPIKVKQCMNPDQPIPEGHFRSAATCVMQLHDVAAGLQRLGHCLDRGDANAAGDLYRRARVAMQRKVIPG